MFIGSSSEMKPVVDKCVEAFSGHASCIPWFLSPEFKTRGSFTTFQALCEAAGGYDFALFILSADDQLEHRENHFSCPRDNVIFEMGLFIGAIGPKRVFAIVESVESPKLKIPSDLNAVYMPRFNQDKDDPVASIASVNEAIQGFKLSIDEEGFRGIWFNLAVGWEFDPTDRNFKTHLSAGKLNLAKQLIGNSQIAIVVRIRNQDINFEDDPDVVFSIPRSVPTPLTGMTIRIAETDFSRTVEENEVIEARVLRVRKNLNLTEFKTLSEAQASGVRIFETLSVKVD